MILKKQNQKPLHLSFNSLAEREHLGENSYSGIQFF